MTYVHALSPKIASGSVQNESYVVKPFWGPYRMKTVLAPPPPQAGRDGRKRKHGFGVELRVIAGLLYRNPAMTYMHAINPKITLASVQNEACVEKSLWRPYRMKNCARAPTALSRAGGARTETRVWRGTAGHRRASSQEPCDDLHARHKS